MAQSREQWRKVGFRHEKEADRQSSVFPVGSLDPVIPVEFFRFERGLPVHFESKDLVELALRGQRQAHSLAEHILFAETQDRRLPGCAR